jgi:ankyrin repeat protein
MPGTELLEAIAARDSDRALDVLRRRPDLSDKRDAEGLSPLMQAVYRGMGDVVSEIRRVRPDLDVFEAAAVGDGGTLARAADINVWSTDGFTPLHLACFFNQKEAVRLLLGRGAAVEVAARNERFAAGAHPLHSAVAAGAHEIAVMLLEAGANPNATQHGGYPALTEAAENGNSELAEALLGYGADPRITLTDGTTAADLARKAGKPELAERLEAAAQAR